MPAQAPSAALPTLMLRPLPTATPTILPSPTSSPTRTISPTSTPAVLVGAGDIATCGDIPESQGDEKTVAIIESVLREYPHAAVFTAGDNAYGEGTRAQFKNCFGPTWGKFKDRIHPAIGNHEYLTDQGAPYFEYFGEAAGAPGEGFYSYDLGDWHILVMNSNCDYIACGPNSRQVAWMTEDLKANPTQCSLAVWHHPRFSSGLAGDSGIINPFWRTAIDLGVDVIVSGHDHDYERFDPMDALGNADPNGARLFVVGAGGGELRGWGEIKPNSVVRYNGDHGVISFVLYPNRYEWTFHPAEDLALTDSGSADCH